MRWIIGWAAAAALVAPAPVVAQETADSRPPAVSVSATAHVLREPDRARVLLAVESREATAREASRVNAEKMDRVIAALRRAGIAEQQIRTVSYQLTPRYEYHDDREPRQQLVGYEAINMVQVLVEEVQRTGPVIDAAIGAGANRVASLGFELRDPDAARLEALREATLKARAEAEAIASALGARLGEPISVSSTGGYEPPPAPPRPMMMEARVARERAEPTPIQPGELRVSASIIAVFRLVPTR